MILNLLLNTYLTVIFMKILEECNPDKERKIVLIVFDDMIADMIGNK